MWLLLSSSFVKSSVFCWLVQNPPDFFAAIKLSFKRGQKVLLLGYHDINFSGGYCFLRPWLGNSRARRMWSVLAVAANSFLQILKYSRSQLPAGQSGGVGAEDCNGISLINNQSVVATPQIGAPPQFKTKSTLALQSREKASFLHR